MLLSGLGLGGWAIFERSHPKPLGFSQQAVQASSPMPGSATAAPPRLGPQQQLHYEDWVALLQQEVDAVAAHRPTEPLAILAGDSLSLWFPEPLLPDQQLWLNQGISGETSTGLLKRLAGWRSLQPQRIFLMIGINDLIRGESPETVLSNYRAILKILRQEHPQTEIIVQSILPHDGPKATWEGKAKLQQIPIEQIQQMNRQLAAIAQQESVLYLDLYELFRDRQGYLRQDLTTDGLHLNVQGYWVWSTALKMFEQQAFEQQAFEQQANAPRAGIDIPTQPSGQ